MSLFFSLKEESIEKIKLLELFGGIGAIRKALINLKIDYEVVDYVELDKNCVKSYNALYEENFKPQSVIAYHPPDATIDIVMHGSPCQDFSRVGEKKGGIKGSGTRSSLLFETIRILEEMKQKPTWVIWENVKGVLDKNMRASFFHYLEELKRLGYKSKYEILNAMDFGIPQKRERIFVISKLDKNSFNFESLEKSTTRPLAEFLENDVSSLYEVKQESMLKMLDEASDYKPKFRGRLKVIQDFAYTISTKQVRVPNSGILEVKKNVYRYLTERECFRLMGFSDEDFNKVSILYPRRKNCTSSILYKQAGNSIVVDVLVAILQEIIKTEGEINETN